LFATHWGAEYTSYALFLREDLGLSKIAMGWYMSGEFGAILLTTLLVGKRLRGNGWMIPAAVAGLVFSGIGHIGMTLEPVPLSFGFRCLHGVGDGLIFLLFYVGIARLFKIERLGGNAGLLNLATLVGMVIGSLVFGPVGEAFGYAIPFWISGGLMLVLIAPLLLGPGRKSMV
jgi:MFS family permease